MRHKLLEVIDAYRIVHDKVFESSKHPRNPDGEFTFKGTGTSGKKTPKPAGKAPKVAKPAKPKAPVKAQLYAKVQELGLEKGETGKYKKATNAKLMALIAKTQGWKPANSASLKGLNPFISLEVLKELKGILENVNLSSPEEANAAINLEKAKKLKAAQEAEKAYAEKKATNLKKVEKVKKSPKFNEAKEAEKIAKKLSSLSFSELHDHAASLGIKSSYSFTKGALTEKIALVEVGILKTATYGPKGVAASSEPWTPEKASFQQKRALDLYTNGAYKFVNDSLRTSGLTNSKEHLKKHAKTIHYLDEIFSHSSFNEDVFRGVSVKTFQKIAAETGNFKEGAILSDLGYGSFTKSKKFAEGWKPCLIRVEGGGPGLVDISSLSQYEEEQEVLASRGIQMRIKKFDEKSKTLTVEIVGKPSPKALKTQDSLEAELASWAEPGVAKTLRERWDLDEEDPNFMMAGAAKA